MKNLFFALLLFISLSSFSYSVDSFSFFPLTEGSEWQYNTFEKGKEDRSFIMNVFVDGTEMFENRTYPVLSQKDKRGMMRTLLEIRDEGIFAKKTSVSKFYTPEISTVHEPAIPLFVFTLDKGYTFHWKGKLKIAWITKDLSVDGMVLGEETITVPAGTFNCVKLHFRQKRNNEITDEYAWYASGVGQVKYIGTVYIKELMYYLIK